MDPTEIRKQTIIALFSDDFLYDRLVLKGGNAIRLAHDLPHRASLDLDFSMAGDFEDLDEAEDRLFASLKRHFSALGYVVFDEVLHARPDIKGLDMRPWWGGYAVSFKLISREKYGRLRDRPDKMSIDSLVTGPHQRRAFGIDLSKHEYTDSKTHVEFGPYVIPVYTLEMIAIEKLRAICQQMPEYGLKERSTKRARDFYDIHLIVSERNIDLATDDNKSLLQKIFAAKRVPLGLLTKVSLSRDFHREDWPSVIDAIGNPVESYDFYFDFALSVIARLQPFREEDAPA